MTESYTDGLRSSAVALLHSPLKRLAVPVIAIVAMAGLAEFLTYFAVAPAPVSQSAALAARGRPSNEDIVKACRLATEDRQPVVAQDAVFYTDQQPIAGPVPLPKRRP